MESSADKDGLHAEKAMVTMDTFVFFLKQHATKTMNYVYGMDDPLPV